MTIYKFLSFLLVVLTVGLSFAPSPASAQAELKPIIETIKEQPDFSKLVEFIQLAGLEAALSGSGPYTVFAPSNAAFAKLGKADLDALLADSQKLQRVLLYHVVPERMVFGEVSHRPSAITMAELPLVFKRVNNRQTYVNNAQIVQSDLFAANGVIHKVDTVILPPERDIVDTMDADPRFRIWSEAIQKAGLADTFKGKGPYTLFAPTDTALSKLSLTVVKTWLADQPKIKNMVQYLSAEKLYFSGDISRLSFIPVLNGLDLVATVNYGKTFVNNVRLNTTDILTTNGVIHVLDTMILPPEKDLVDAAAADPQLRRLTAAIEKAGLTETLKGKGPFTLFAPTDVAFGKLGQAKYEELLADPEKLKSVLLYHVVPSKIYSRDAMSMSSAITANGMPVAVTYRFARISINNALIITKYLNILTTNGVIHLIDQVNLPPDKDIFDTASADPQLKTLATALQTAGLKETLKGKGPFTVFAPSDAAFRKLGQGTIDTLLSDPSRLKTILQYHTLNGAQYYADLNRVPVLTTLSGAKAVVMPSYPFTYLNKARIMVINILATNGVIHIIDTVNLPPEKNIIDTLAADPQFKTLSAAIQAAGMTDTFKGTGPTTLFAPTDAAFKKLGQKAIDELMANPDKLKNVLLYHTVQGEVYPFQFGRLNYDRMMNGAGVTVDYRHGSYYINSARVINSNILTTNGVIHVIDTVLLPPPQ